MQLVLVPIFLSAFFASVALFFALRYKRNRILWPFIGAFLGIAALLPFRTYRVAPLNPALEASIVSDSIINTKDILIPGYPDAYNPSLIPYEEGYLLSFRVRYYNLKTFIKKVCNVRTAYVGLVKLNRQLEISGEPYLLDLTSYADHSSTSAQDARLFKMGEKILLFFNDYGSTRHRSCYSLYVTELIEKEGKFQAKQHATLLKYDSMLSIEKNWIPFLSNDKLYLIYSTQPHLILEPNLETGICQRVASTETPFSWKWGEIRGGTPAHPIEGGLLTFFHSSQELPAASFFGTKVGRNYAMGAYLFENRAPFAVRKITPSPIGSAENYMHKNRRKVIFPAGMAIEGNIIYVVWGKNDTGICLSTFDKEKLLSSMTTSLD